MPCAALSRIVLLAFAWDSSGLVARGDDGQDRRRRATAGGSAKKESTGKAPGSRETGRAGEKAEARSRLTPERGRQTAKNAAAPAAGKPVSFIRDVAPILVENCIACHNPRKSESKYVMTTFTQLAKGGQQGEGITLEPGKPDESNLVEVIRPEGKPRMPYKHDPLPKEKIATIERWVAEGAKYDGGLARRRLDRRPAQDSASHDSDRLSRDSADHGAGIQPGRLDDRRVGLS